MKIQISTSAKPSVSVPLTPAQKTEMYGWIEDNPSTCSNAVRVVGNQFIVDTDRVKSIISALFDDFDLETGFERPVSQKRSMLKLASLLKQKAEAPPVDQAEWVPAVMRKTGSVKRGFWNSKQKRFIIDINNAPLLSKGFNSDRLKLLKAQVEVKGKVVSGK